MGPITKQFDAEFKLDKDSREFIAVISTDAIDRVGDVVLPKGLRKKQFSGNPVVLINHDSDRLPVGTCRWIKADGNKLIAKTYVTDKTQDGRDIFGLLQDGVIGAMSVSFMPIVSGLPTAKELKERPELGSARQVIREWELLEYSIVTIPCNPECLAMAVAKGYSDNILKFFNNGQLPKDYCQWDTEPELAPVVTVPEAKALPVVEVKPVDKWAHVPMPVHSKSLDKVLAEKVAQLHKGLESNEMLDRYLGRV